MKSKIIYVCPFVPAEWVAAHGMRPSRIVPPPVGEAGAALPANGVCPYARAFAAEAAAAADAAATVVTTACDQMRRAADIIRKLSDTPLFVLNVPHTWRAATAHTMYASEIRRLGGFLANLGGEPPGPERLAETVLEYESARQALRNLAGQIPPGRWAEALAAFCAGEPAQTPTDEVHAPRGVPLALVGGPMMADSFALYDLVEQAGGWVALDATETGERTLPAPIDRGRLRDDPLGALADAYFGAIPDAFRRPNSQLYTWLARGIEERRVRGIVYRRYVWCDTWHAEARRMREWAARAWPGIGFLELDAGDDGFEAARALSRLQSFVEVLK